MWVFRVILDEFARNRNHPRPVAAEKAVSRHATLTLNQRLTLTNQPLRAYYSNRIAPL